MKTTFDAENVLYAVLTDSNLLTAVTGTLEKWYRTGEGNEDVVINSLPMSANQTQRCVLNVNVYVADLHLKIGGKMQYQPNMARLHELAIMAVEVLQEGYGEGYNYWLENQHTVEQPETHEHYINLRVDFQFTFSS